MNERDHIRLRLAIFICKLSENLSKFSAFVTDVHRVSTAKYVVHHIEVIVGVVANRSNRRRCLPEGVEVEPLGTTQFMNPSAALCEL